MLEINFEDFGEIKKVSCSVRREIESVEVFLEDGAVLTLSSVSGKTNLSVRFKNLADASEWQNKHAQAIKKYQNAGVFISYLGDCFSFCWGT